MGHHFVKLLKGETSDSTNVAAFRALLHNATQKSAERLSCNTWIQGRRLLNALLPKSGSFDE